MRVGNTWWGRGCKKSSNKQKKTTRVIDGGVIRFVWGSSSTFNRFSDSEPEYLVKRDKDDIIIDLRVYWSLARKNVLHGIDRAEFADSKYLLTF